MEAGSAVMSCLGAQRGQYFFSLFSFLYPLAVPQTPTLFQFALVYGFFLHIFTCLS